jgi:hypothetical protein
METSREQRAIFDHPKVLFVLSQNVIFQSQMSQNGAIFDHQKVIFLSQKVLFLSQNVIFLSQMSQNGATKRSLFCPKKSKILSIYVLLIYAVWEIQLVQKVRKTYHQSRKLRCF